MPGLPEPPFPRRIDYRSEGADVVSSEVNPTTNDCYITQVRVNDTSGSANTFTLTDNASGANQWYEAVPISAQGVIHENLIDEPLFCEGGFGFQAAGTAEVRIVYYVRGDESS